MTTELQRAMARYEAARIAYRKAVLSSLNGDARGDAIRCSIREIQAASSELKRVRGVPPRPTRVVEPEPTPTLAAGFGLVRRLLSVG